MERVVTPTVDDPEWVSAAVFEQHIAHPRWFLLCLPFEQDNSRIAIKKYERAFQVVQHHTLSDHAFTCRLCGLHGPLGPGQYPELAMFNWKTQPVALLLDMLRRF